MLLRKLYYYYKILKTQYLSQERLKELQLKWFKQIINYTYKNNQFYRKKWDKSQFDPSEVEKLEDLKKIPYTSRKELTENFPNPVMTEEKAYSRSTSGSSGRKPLEVAWNEQSYDFSEAVYLRSLTQQGYKPWKKKAYYWHEEFDQNLYNRFFMKKERIPTELDLDEQLERLQDLETDVWYYFGGILFSIAKKASREEKWDLNPEIIITHAEILTENMKETIEETFEAEVYDQYGTTEFNRMAWQCKEGNYHLDAETILFEFENTDKGPEIVCTSLIKTGMPMIRYRMGDIIEPKKGECPCGRSLPMIKPPEGRKSNFIKNFSPRDIIQQLDDIIDFVTFQIEFDGEKLILKYTKNKDFDIKSVEKASKRLENFTGLRAETVNVERIPKTDGGKRPMVKNTS